jgi:hypothetical protein
LHEHPDGVGFAPVFDNLAIGKAINIDARHYDRYTPRPDSEPLALVGATLGHLCDDQIAFGDCASIVNWKSG